MCDRCLRRTDKNETCPNRRGDSRIAHPPVGQTRTRPAQNVGAIHESPKNHMITQGAKTPGFALRNRSRNSSIPSKNILSHLLKAHLAQPTNHSDHPPPTRRSPQGDSRLAFEKGTSAFLPVYPPGKCQPSSTNKTGWKTPFPSSTSECFDSRVLPPDTKKIPPPGRPTPGGGMTLSWSGLQAIRC